MVRRRSSGSTTQASSIVGSTKANGVEIGEIGPPPAKRLRPTRSTGKDEKEEKNEKNEKNEENVETIMRNDESNLGIAEETEEVADEKRVDVRALFEEIPSTSAARLTDVEMKLEKIEKGKDIQAEISSQSPATPFTQSPEVTNFVKLAANNSLATKRMAAQRSENPYAKILEKPSWQHPQWSEPFRGILITLVDQRGVDQMQMNSPQLLQAKEIGKNMIKFKSIAELLGDGMKCAGVTENVILEKWAWLCEMNYRSQVVAKTTGLMRWRFSNAMKAVPTQDNVFIGILSEDRFDHLCDLFETTDQDNLMRAEYRQIVTDLSHSFASHLANIACSSVPSAKMSPKDSLKAPKLPPSITNGHSTITFVHQDSSHEPTVREALNARRVKQISDQKKGQIVILPIAQNDPDVAEFERLCGEQPSKDSKFWTRPLIKSFLNEMKGNGKFLDEITTKDLTNLVEKLQKEHGISWLSAEECRNRLLELRLCAAKLSQKSKLQLDSELQNLYFSLQTSNNRLISSSASSNHATDPSTSTPSLGSKEVKREVDTDGTTESIKSNSSSFPLRSPPINLAELLSNALQEQSNPATAIAINDGNIWMPPREEEVAGGSRTTATATATATVMVKPLSENQMIGSTVARGRGRASNIGSASLQATTIPSAMISSNAPPLKISNHQQAATTTIFAASPTPTVDKWTLLGQLITEQARELERAKGMVAAVNFQKAITDLIASYYK